MSNHASVTVIFDGSQKQLNKIYDMILVDGIEGKSVNFNYVEPFLPGLSDRQIYALFGADVDKDYSQEEIDIFHNKVNKLLSDNGWIGLRDHYINTSSHNSVAFFKEDSLVVQTTFSSYTPTLFFHKIATDFKCSMAVLEYMEGMYTLVSYVDKNGQCFDSKNTNDNILNNEEFRDYSIKLGLHKPEDLALVAIVCNKKNLAKKLIKDYDITSDQMSFAVNSMFKFCDDPFDFYNSSHLIDLNLEELSKLNSMDLMHQFAKLEDSVKKSLHPKKIM